MKKRWPTRAIAASLCCLQISPLALAQAPAGDRSPRVTWNSGFPRNEFRPGTVSNPDFRNSARLSDLIRNGQIYLSLDDAIALALENNLDLELERYGVRMASADRYRAEGGGVVRGVPLTVNEAPAGIGGPTGSPLINTAATGATPQSVVSVSVTDTQLIAESQNNLNVTGTFPFSNGPAIPLYDPVITGTLLGQKANTPQASPFSTGSTDLSATSFSGNVGYLEGFSTGTQVSAAFQNQYQDQTTIRNLFAPYYLSSAGFTITQPLLRGFGKDINKRFIHIARNSEKISDYVFRQQVISTVSGVIRLYDDLVSLNADLRVKQQTLATAQRLLEDNRNKVEQGTLAPIEATRAQAQVASAQQDVINSEGFVRQQEIILKNVLARDWGTDPLIHDARIIPTDTLSLDALPSQSTNEILSLALDNRPEYQAAKLQLVNSEISLKGTKNSLLPQLDIVGGVTGAGIAGGYNAVSGGSQTLPGVNGNYGTSLGQIFTGTYPTYSVGINLTLPVRNRIAQADVVRDELQVRQTQVRLKQIENQIRAEVEDALIALQRTHAAYQAATETADLQQQSLAIEQDKFDVGLSTNFLVIQYQGYLAQARSTQVAALDAYAKARTQFERTIGMTLDRHNISVDEAFRGVVTRQSTPAFSAQPPAPPSPAPPQPAARPQQ